MDTDATARTGPEADPDRDNAGRRATFLPSASESAVTPPADDTERYDDDALAAAMADEAERLGLTGAIQIMPPPTSPAVSTPLPPPMARAVATGPGAPEAPTAPHHQNQDAAAGLPPQPRIEMPAPAVADASPTMPRASSLPIVIVTPMPGRSLAGFPAPSGEPIVFDPEPSPLPTAPSAASETALPTGAALPTRRSIRDAEQARTREQNVERQGAKAPSPVIDDPLPVPEVTPSPDFSPAPGAPDSSGEFGDTSPVSTIAAAAQPSAAMASNPQAPVPEAVSPPPFYDLIEPQPYSAGPAVFPLGYNPPAVDPRPTADPLSPPPPSEPLDPFAALIADTASRSNAEVDFGVPDDTDPDDTDLDARSTTNPWLQSAALGVVEAHPVSPSPFLPESSGSTPTPLDARVGRASRLFWLWFAANSSVLSLAFGGAIFSLGMSLRQAVVAIFIGVAISFLPLGLGTLAGKWSGQPVMVVSRAAFGHFGNIVPASIALLTRLFWGAVLLWMIAAATARILVGARLAGSLTEVQLMVLVMGIGFLLALVIAYFGYALFARIQLVLSILSGLLIVALVAITWPAIDFAAALTVGDGPVILVVTGVVLVFSFVGLVWANSSGDLARYQRPSSSGGAAMLWASFGTTLPAFLLIGYGAVLAASNATTAKGLGTSPIDTIAGLLPSWYPVPLIAATALSLLSGVILSIYSGGFALGAIGLRVPRTWATAIVGVLVFAVAIALGFTVSNVVMVFRDLATTLAVPVAAWAGIFSAEMIVRRRRFDTRSLVARGGIYRDVNWLNLAMLVVASAIGLGFTSATVAGLRWEGYLFAAAGVPLSSPLGGTDVGVLVALALGLLTPFVAGVSTVRRQELRQASRT